MGDEESITPLNAEHLPELMSITGLEALEYVTQLLCRLVELHASDSADYSDPSRRPSYDTAIEQCPGVLLQLMPKRFIVDSAVVNEEGGQNESEEERIRQADGIYKRFWLKEPPPISIRDYLHRFHRYCESSPATYLTAGSLVYLVSMELKSIPVTQRNVYRLFCAAFIVSAKFIEDKLYSMSRYATTAGLKKSELAKLELSFLLLINFNIRADREVLKTELKTWALLNNDALLVPT